MSTATDQALLVIRGAPIVIRAFAVIPLVAGLLLIPAVAIQALRGQTDMSLVATAPILLCLGIATYLVRTTVTFDFERNMAIRRSGFLSCLIPAGRRNLDDFTHVSLQDPRTFSIAQYLRGGYSVALCRDRCELDPTRDRGEFLVDVTLDWRRARRRAEEIARRLGMKVHETTPEGVFVYAPDVSESVRPQRLTIPDNTTTDCAVKRLATEVSCRVVDGQIVFEIPTLGTRRWTRWIIGGFLAVPLVPILVAAGVYTTADVLTMGVFVILLWLLGVLTLLSIRADLVTLSSEALSLKRRSWYDRQNVTIPFHELRRLEICKPKWGNLECLIDQYSGRGGGRVISAEGAEELIEFGYSLSEDEMKWLMSIIEHAWKRGVDHELREIVAESSC